VDYLFRVIFKASPIIVHAPDEKQAIEVAIKYLRQPGTGRIVVEADRVAS